ncbi:glycosyltransferase family 4 protein [Nocardioides sp. TRM66260-LWL]|uniref:glycosyltransferase family 4 protein n=1 Tax=Nocardioides sp. TRM66260-LWL TaxID=2874478 RepID=UPI001CC4BE56|nr:glycosyltransferase family 4 protein [Nocardioides sp. TRM66260-LWL]MBZ5735511.1 glycosyltransferase family 4 protein [Nocardioides sp. TRM66260-LWL]
MGAGSRRLDAAGRTLRDAPAAAVVTLRHLLRATAHVGGVPAPWQDDPRYRAALDAHARGELRLARELARAAGPVGPLLARLIDGELAMLLAPVPAGPLPPRRLGPPAPAGAERVLHLVTNSEPEIVAGYTVRTRGITEQQVRDGAEVHVVSRLGFPVSKGRLGVPARRVVAGVVHHRLLGPRLPLRADDALRLDVERASRVVEQVRPDVLHAHSNHLNGRVGLALRRRHGVPLLYEVRGLLEETWRSRAADPDAAARTDFHRLSRESEAQVMRAADAVVTLSTALREQVIARGVDPARVHVVPNCVDDSWLAEPVPPRAPGAGLTVGIGGTLNAYEGVDLLVEAVALLRTRGRDVRLLVAGDGPARAALETLAAERGLGDAATFTGRLDRAALADAYRRLDVFCLPRRDLPVTRVVPPIKPVEAMALGLPVLAADLPPLREIVGEDRGVLVRPDDPEAIAAGLEALADPAERAHRGAAARRWVADTRTWRAATHAYAAVYGTMDPTADARRTAPDHAPAHAPARPEPARRTGAIRGETL